MDIIKEFKVFNDLDKGFVPKIKSFTIFGGGKKVMIVTKSDLVFVFRDKDTNGWLGMGIMDESVMLMENNYLSNKQIIDICFGSSHIISLTKSGRCMSWSRNGWGQLGYESNETINKPKVIESLSGNEMITAISCGVIHSMVLTDNGVVYTFGDNQYKQLGSEERTGLPQKVEITSTITAISCGGYHCLAINNSGQVFIWGDNCFRQCLFDKSVKYCLPFILKIPEKVCQISGSLTHTLVLTEDKTIYSIGCIECYERNDTSEALTGICSHDSDIIQKPFGDRKFINIISHCGINLFIIKSIEGQCYVWGHTVNGFVKYEKTDYKNIEIAFSLLNKYQITSKSIKLSHIWFESNAYKMSDKMKNIFNNQKDSDFIFKFNDKQIFVHKFILKTLCEHFKTLFSENWDKLNSNEIQIKSHSYPTYYAFIQYLYTDVIELNNEYIYEFYDLANSYLSENLKCICVELIKDMICFDNVLNIYLFSQKYELKVLEKSCLEFCSDKWNQLFKSENFKQLDKTIVMEIIEKASDLRLF